ncbi:MAG: hypothetical protein NVSMB64_28410 [Candidatus Velthaea sp.]
MTLEIPSLLMLLGAALMAVAIFAPQRLPAESLALAAGAAFNAWHTLPQAQVIAPDYAEDFVPAAIAPLPELTWPALVDSGAVNVERSVRLAMVEALASLRAPWADEILRRALREETDAGVQAALERACV